MKDILIEIDRLAAEELERANKIHPFFNSDHEGESVIREEMEETKACVKAVGQAYKRLWRSIKGDDEEGANISALEMRDSATYAAAELIQVIAMCDKFIKSQEVRDENKKDV